MKILIINTAFIGDIILLSPLIKAIKQLYPKAILDVVVIPQSASALRHNPNINKLILFDKRKGKLKQFFKTLFLLRKQKYDLAFLPHSSATTLQLAYFAGIKKRIGFNKNKASILLTNKVEFKTNIHRIYKNLDLLKPLTNKDFSTQTEIFFTKDEQKKANSMLTGLTGTKIAIAPGSVWATKCWTASYYKQLASQLNLLGYALVFTGSKDEEDICNKIAPGTNFVNTAGKLSINESAAVISNCSLMICNDSGALHIANAVKTTVFAFFGPTVKAFGYYPYRQNDIIFETSLSCRPCGKHGSRVCPKNTHDCMKNIKPQQVLTAVKKFFSK